MPRKGADKPAQAPAPAADPPAATAEERAAARQAHAERFTEDKDQGVPEGGIEDWTRPDYADNPGEFEFAALDDSTEFLSVLWWGKEGTGKTTDLARIAATKLVESGDTKGRVLIINAEGGAKATPLRHHGIDTSIIDVYPKPGASVTFEGLERLFYKIQADLEQDPHSWAAVGWDSITAIFQKLLDDVIETEMRKQAEILQKARKGREGRSGNITLRDRFETDGDDYAKMTNQVRLLLRKYHTLPCHFMVTALERRDEDKKKRGASRIQYGPAVNPALATDLLGYMDIVIHTDVLDSAVYYGRTTPTEDARGKDRMFALPVEMVDPTFDRILGYVRGSIKHETDAVQKLMPNGAEGVLTRRSLADDASDLSYDPPEQGDPEPPKAGRKPRGGAAARSGRTTASAEPNATEEPAASEPASAATEPEPAADAPKASGRKPRASGASSGRTRATASKSAPPASETSSTASDEPSPGKTAGTEDKPAPTKRGGRLTTAERQARAKVQADTEPPKSGPATRAAGERARKAEEAKIDGDGTYNDEPPF